jgi:uncharacterized protein with PQ loop repeat
MQFDILDPNVSISMNIFLVIANIINLFYNIPQIIKTYKCKSTKDFSPTFLFLRIIGNSIWIAYSIEINSLLFLINNIVTVLASIFIGYYKSIELIKIYNYNKKLNNNLDNNNLDNNNLNNNLYYNNLYDNNNIIVEMDIIDKDKDVYYDNVLETDKLID